MFSSRNIHFAILGLILGASTGYIFAFYQAGSSVVAPAQQGSQTGAQTAAPANHPDVTPEALLQMFQVALKNNPNEPELLSRYGSFLFNLGRFQESVDAFQKSLVARPNHWQTMEDLFNAQLEGVKDPNAAEATLRKMEQVDPKHASLPTLRQRLQAKKAAD
jgi:Tfp pilus assembly protein PilF